MVTARSDFKSVENPIAVIVTAHIEGNPIHSRRPAGSRWASNSHFIPYPRAILVDGQSLTDVQRSRMNVFSHHIFCFAEDKVNDLLTSMASNVTLEVGQVTMSPIAASGRTVTMSANGHQVPGTYRFPNP